MSTINSSKDIRKKVKLRYAKLLFSWICMGAFCMVTTICLFLETYYVKNTVPITEIFRRYLSSLILGLLFGRYAHLLRIPRNSSETVYKFTVLLWFKWVFLYGILYWGFGVATFGLLGYKFMFGFSFLSMTVSLPVIIFHIYTLFFITGFCFGNFTYIISYTVVKYKQNKNRNKHVLP
jgi:hypothetical protein